MSNNKMAALHRAAILFKRLKMSITHGLKYRIGCLVGAHPCVRLEAGQARKPDRHGSRTGTEAGQARGPVRTSAWDASA